MAKELKRRDLSGIFIFDTFPGETTAQLVPCHPNGEPQYDSPWPDIELSRAYDIEGRHRQSAEAEEQEIIAIERDCLTRLRTFERSRQTGSGVSLRAKRTRIITN